MNDSIYYASVANLLASLQVPVAETATLRSMADLMDETMARGKASQDAETQKDVPGDVA